LIDKKRTEPVQLLNLRYLNIRGNLTEKERHYYTSLEKGYEGEVLFDERIQGFSDSWLFLNDVMLEHQNNYFQMDSLGFFQEDLYLFEVKNYEGDFVVEGDKWKSTLGKDIKNPLHQLQRCETFLRRFLQDQGFTVTIKPYLIFINPSFTLYQAPLNPSLIFPTQLNNFLSGLNRAGGRLGSRQRQISNVLKAAHVDKYPGQTVPSYEYRNLKKGFVCSRCGSWMHVSSKQRGLVCTTCGRSEELDMAVMRSVAEFQLLFPEKKVNTVEIWEWCGNMPSKKTIQRILTRNFQRIGHNKAAYYI
jgi:DNA-directed RNA polymerase subunit M/transcription elongation factor TFIIS